MGEERDKLVSDAIAKSETAKQLLERIKFAQNLIEHVSGSRSIEIYKGGVCFTTYEGDKQIFEKICEAITISLKNEIFLCENNLIRLFGGENYGW